MTEDQFFLSATLPETLRRSAKVATTAYYPLRVGCRCGLGWYGEEDAGIARPVNVVVFLSAGDCQAAHRPTWRHGACARKYFGAYGRAAVGEAGAVARW